jgi:hypothetical protein
MLSPCYILSLIDSCSIWISSFQSKISQMTASVLLNRRLWGWVLKSNLTSLPFSQSVAQFENHCTRWFLLHQVRLPSDQKTLAWLHGAAILTTFLLKSHWSQASRKWSLSITPSCNFPSSGIFPDAAFSLWSLAHLQYHSSFTDSPRDCGKQVT